MQLNQYMNAKDYKPESMKLNNIKKLHEHEHEDAMGHEDVA